MEFLKKHYEKVLLGAVLLGLAIAVAFLPFLIAGEREKLEEARTTIIKHPIKSLPPQDLSQAEGLLKDLGSTSKLVLSTSNRLFNPVQWQRTSDGRRIKIETGNEVGPKAVVITQLTPLYMTVTLDMVEQSDTTPRYRIGVEREGALLPSQRYKRQYSMALNNKSDLFTLRGIKGPPDNPTGLVLELNDTGELALVSKSKPYKRVDGYTVDLKYDPEKKIWLNRRLGSALTFAGEQYNIVAISSNEVVLSAKSNNKKTTITYKGVP